jgi:polyhydroxybutyrate depolymerase
MKNSSIKFNALALLAALPYFLFAQNTITGTIQSGGLVREYRLYKPAIYDGSVPVPVVLNFHGYTSNNLQQEFYGSFKDIADTANFLIVLPNGTTDNQGQRFWNTFNGPYPVDDVAFVADLLDSLATEYNIDPNRIYSTGMSNGGFMSYQLACELNDRIAAIASVTGSMTTTNLTACTPARPVPVMEIHGTADNTVPYNGMVLLGFASVPAVVDNWVGHNQCNPTATVETLPNTSTIDGCTAERYLYSGGTNGSTVEHYKILGGGHTWPGAVFNVGVTNQDMNASKEIWRFFSQYSLDQLSSTTVLAPQNQLKIAPNPAVGTCVVTTSASEGLGLIQVLDLMGRLVLEAQGNGQSSITLDVASLSKGYYVIRVQDEDGSVAVVKVAFR